MVRLYYGVSRIESAQFRIGSLNWTFHRIEVKWDLVCEALFLDIHNKGAKGRIFSWAVTEAIEIF